jgi:cell fate regulator YaaT (PSP1 superfamily)
MENIDEVKAQDTDLEMTKDLGAFAVVSVRFQPAGKVYHFTAASNLDIKLYDWVVVETVYGEQAGQVMEIDAQLPDDVSPQKMRSVIRVAAGLDMARYNSMQERSERIIDVGREEAEQNKIDLKIISAEFTLDGNHAIVVCTGNPNKKELATLRRRLATRMSCRVELRIVGPRDHAKALCGYGVCGEERCCCRFLTEFQSVSIRMAKDQSISMAPTDITGMCGRLRCCLAYEHKVYKQESQNLPRLKSRVQTENGLGRVIDLDILKGDVIVEIPPDGPRRDRKRFRYHSTEVDVVKTK